MNPPEPPAPDPAGPVAPVHPGAPPADPERPEGVVTDAPAAVPAGGTADAETRWKPWGSVVAFFGGFAGAIFGGAIIAALAGAGGASLDDLPAWARIASVVVQDVSLVAVAALVAYVTVRETRPWSFGLRPPPSWLRAVGWLALAYLAFMVFSAVWISALDLKNEKDTLPTDFGVQDSQVVLIAVAALVCVVAPLAEELFFRGFFFRSLANWAGVWPAAVLTGLTFGLVHLGGSPIGFIVPLAFLGFVLCVLYWKTRSLLPCIAVHCVNNCIAYGRSGSVDWTWQIPVAIVVSFAIIGAILLLVRRLAGPAPPVPPWPAGRPGRTGPAGRSPVSSARQT